MWLFHASFQWLFLALVLIATPPVLLFPSRTWAREFGGRCGLGLGLVLVLSSAATYGTHWDLQHGRFTSASGVLEDGCPVEIGGMVSAEWSAKNARPFTRSVLATLLVVSLGSFWYDARNRSRRR